MEHPLQKQLRLCKPTLSVGSPSSCWFRAHLTRGDSPMELQYFCWMCWHLLLTPSLDSLGRKATGVLQNRAVNAYPKSRPSEQRWELEGMGRTQWQWQQLFSVTSRFQIELRNDSFLLLKITSYFMQGLDLRVILSPHFMLQTFYCIKDLHSSWCSLACSFLIKLLKHQSKLPFIETWTIETGMSFLKRKVSGYPYFFLVGIVSVFGLKLFFAFPAARAVNTFISSWNFYLHDFFVPRMYSECSLCAALGFRD